jgi:GNAT superfamily N-acetyltransferase
MQYRVAMRADALMLARMNHDLIQDEGHRNKMTVDELERRMADWIASGEYQGVLFEQEGLARGYALFRRESEFVYLRQFFIQRDFRRKGLGRAAYKWLSINVWAGSPRIRLDVLIDNEPARAFWQSVGFKGYCLTMEMEQS